MGNNPEVDFLHKMASRMASADPLQEVLAQIVEFAASVVNCDSCFLYALEDGDLILRASKNAHPDVVDRLKLRLGQGITGWVAEHRQPVAVALNASQDPRFQLFKDLPEEKLEARKIVERAKGILQRELRVTEEEAYLTIQRQSRQRRKSMKEVAEAIVLSEDVKRGLGE